MRRHILCWLGFHQVDRPAVVIGFRVRCARPYCHWPYL